VIVVGPKLDISTALPKARSRGDFISSFYWKTSVDKHDYNLNTRSLLELLIIGLQ